jgi:hypothetical protein
MESQERLGALSEDRPRSTLAAGSARPTPGSRCALHVIIAAAVIAIPACRLLRWLAWLRFLIQVARDHGPHNARQLGDPLVLVSQGFPHGPADRDWKGPST